MLRLPVELGYVVDVLDDPRDCFCTFSNVACEPLENNVYAEKTAPM